MMKRLFIFDFDGVIVDDEKIWDETKKELFIDVYGSDISRKLGKTSGLDIEAINQKAHDLGSTVSYETAFAEYEKRAKKIYHEAQLTDGINEFVNFLQKIEYHIGIVSASPRDWIDIVLHRVGWSGLVKEIISLNDRRDLAHKPAPDGYIEIIRTLQARADRTIVLEDSNAGIASAKGAGAFVIGFKQNLPFGYELTGADMYAEKISEIYDVISQF